MVKLYNAGLYTSNFNIGGGIYQKCDWVEQEERKSNEWYLESFHYIHKGKAVQNIKRDGVKIFLDSGAFSAFKLGVDVDLNRYCDFIHEHDDIIARDGGTKMIAPLDVIGNAEASFKNLELMEAQGTEPLPCFHYLEPWEFLDHYMSKYSYIAIGGLVRNDLYTLESWFHQLFERICDSNGVPKVRLHGFSLTALQLMLKFPWHSVDSSTWVQWAANGMVLMPVSGKQMNVSSQSSSRKMAMQHIDTLPEVMRNQVVSEITQYGHNLERLQNNYYSRWAYNCWAFPWYVHLRQHEAATHYIPKEGLFH